ncbi:uncharacterized protein klar isoform X2 [Venturia canescens]|uniref:uncharacterized protein klar isoform X2 n=1 Tax=Venturia canescens TaxID=32260 RepID=UPI001C9CB305|nr:uncharacterized protein LOC122406964 isoform X2 [Venturia canescens]
MNMERIIINNRPSKAMKMSFSCSSLQRSSDSLEGPEHARMRVDRPYNSLTKKRFDFSGSARKEPKQEHCQRTWGSRDDCRDDFWAAIRSNYHYIMDTDLIDSCKEANGELVWDEGDVSTLSWGIKEVSCQFSELYSWLGVLQEMVYSKEENLLDKSLRAAHMEELRRKAYRRRLFNEQAGKLVSRAPSLKDEVAWRVDHLNAKWELVEQIMAPVAQPTSDQQDVSADFEHEVKCLRKWLREMESRLQPLSFRVDWTRSELEEKATEHMVLQRDIEAHGRIVNSVVKLGERLARQQRQQQKQQEDEQPRDRDNNLEKLASQLTGEKELDVPPAGRVASSLERRWHLLFLRALEWQCHIETLATRLCNKIVSCRCSSDSDEEPVTKQPRLSRRQSSRGSGKLPRRLGSSLSGIRGGQRDHNPGATSYSSCSESDMSSKNRLIDDESYFEDDLEELCVTESIARGGENFDKIRSSPVIVDQGEEGDIEEEGILSEEERECEEMAPTPGPGNSSIDQIDGMVERSASNGIPNGTGIVQESPKRRRTLDESASFNTSDRKSKNCATFYFKHLDTDSEADCGVREEELQNGVDDSSEEEWTYTASPPENYETRYEQKKANVVVRLDFGEPATVERNDNVNFKTIAAKPNDQLLNDKIILEEDSKFDEEDNNTGTKTPTMKKKKKQKSEGNESENETKNDIQRLILEVEKLVREEGRAGATRNLTPLIFEGHGHIENYRAKYARIKEWLKLNSTHNHEERSASQWLQPLDSCDASGEYTTGESDIEKESVSSEDLQSSVATYRRFDGCGDFGGSVSQSVSQEIFNDNDKTIMNESHSSATMMETSTPKVVMRTKRKSDGPRPWSVSCVFQIAEAVKINSNNDTISQFSISETALHQLVATPPTKSVSLDATGSRVPFNNSTSTLLEENTSGHDGRAVGRDNSLRKKKSRLRRKTVNGGSSIAHTGSDGSSNQQRSVRRGNRSRTIRTISRDCNGRLTTLVKSGSFSGCTAKPEVASEKLIVSDPTSPNPNLSYCRSEASTADTEDNTFSPRTKNCSVYEENPLDIVPIGVAVLNGDSDVEKNSLGNNSFSEQAWDSYQEKYMSEPYSETADVETARRLLDFGDDYRNFLDSQSDCASSMSAVRSSSPPAASSRMHSDNVDSSEESDSDMEDVRRIVERSHKKLVLMENHFSRSPNVRGSRDNMELESVCKENIKCLKTLMDSSGSCIKGDKSAKQVRGLTERWETLSSRAEEAQRASALQRDMAAMHLEFRAAHERLIAHEVVLEPAHVLDDRINKITSELASLRERKAAMLALNVSAHRLITDLGVAATSVSVSLKDAVADLYRVWDETFQRGNQQLCALQAVQQFSTRLTELHCALRRDKDTLAVLDAALQAGATTEVASSVRDVARLLSEKQDVCQNGNVVTPEDELAGSSALKFGDATVMSLTQEGGTFSDSGISDSGSEQELSERERRLAALRRLTRTLESQLAPGSDALVELWKRVEDAEAELRCLQKLCRELIVRTAASVEARAAKRDISSQAKFTSSKRKKRATGGNEIEGKARKSKGGMTDADDPEDEPNVPKSWVWRILRAALPFQLALVALFCAACLLEPHCCEAANTLNLSLTPQLRYVRGPPPV